MAASACALSYAARCRRALISRKQPRLFSTAAVAEAAQEDEEIIHDVNVAPSTTKKSRPRLEELRHKLLSTKHRVDDKERFFPNKQQQHQASSSKKACGSTSSTSTNPGHQHQEQQDNLDDWIQQLEQLPDPPQTSTNILQDSFGRHHNYLRVSLVERCNLRCLYCMPPQGLVNLQATSELLSHDEILQLVHWFVNVGGVTKLRLTGGEPLLRPNLVELIGELRHQNPTLEQIGMTTNGVSLNDQTLRDLQAAGLTHINVSLDSLNADKFAQLTRRPPSYHGQVIKAIQRATALYPPHTIKVNCVVLPSNVDELADFCLWGRDNHVDVRFIEYMPFQDNQWGEQDGQHEMISYKHMQGILQDQHGLQLERAVDGPNDTTKWWRLADTNASSSRIGFITSMTQAFCGTCNRLRITSDGKLKTCLFGTDEVPLKQLMRAGRSDLIPKVVHASVQKKNFSLGGHANLVELSKHAHENRPMTLIGG